MTRTERIAYYRKILAESSSLQLAIDRIVADVNTLVWSNTQQPLSKAERIKILEEIFDDSGFRKSLPSTESFERGYGSVDAVNEADNSHILDVISALKRGAKGS
jgi:hypothetical protein